jgi:hypothetical protein
MKKLILTIAFLSLGFYVYADDSVQFSRFIQSIQAHRVKMEAQYGLNPNTSAFPHATCYYDDLEDHYEHEYLMLDQLTVV